MLPDDLEHVPDVIAVGTQESFSERFEWEVSIQETVGPSHLLLHSATLGTIHLAIFIRRDLLWFCSGWLSVHLSSADRKLQHFAIEKKAIYEFNISALLYSPLKLFLWADAIACSRE
jgi:hypothetical protein